MRARACVCACVCQRYRLKADIHWTSMKTRRACNRNSVFACNDVNDILKNTNLLYSFTDIILLRFLHWYFSKQIIPLAWFYWGYSHAIRLPLLFCLGCSEFLALRVGPCQGPVLSYRSPVLSLTCPYWLKRESLTRRVGSLAVVMLPERLLPSPPCFAARSESASERSTLSRSRTDMRRRGGG